MSASRALVHCLGELEVLDAGLEAGLGIATVDDRVDEVLLDGPFGDEVGGNLKRHELFIAAPRAAVLAELVLSSVQGAMIFARVRRSTEPVLNAAAEMARLIDAEIKSEGQAI